jgi:hypothetical protein
VLAQGAVAREEVGRAERADAGGVLVDRLELPQHDLAAEQVQCLGMGCERGVNGV